MSVETSPTSKGHDVFLSGWFDGWRPSERLLVSDWADKYRILPPKASAEPGEWRTDRVPYIKEILDQLSPQSPAQRIVFMKSAQVAGTEAGLNWIGYNIHQNPGPMLHVQPSIDVLKKVAKQRINAMVESMPCLVERIAENKSRDTGNTMFMKEYPGGILILTGANSAAGLRSMPIRDLFLDEIDAYPEDVDGEGDPVELAIKRTTTFSRRKIFLNSTPTIKGHSRIEDEYLQTDRRRFYVPCPHCHQYQFLRWKDEDGTYRLVWKRDENGNHMPETAQYKCEHCDDLIGESHKTWMLAHGEWRATAKAEDPRMVGYHISALYSPLGWKSWEDIVRDFLKAKGNAEKMKTWVNTTLGETWEEAGDGISSHFLAARAEDYPRGVVPNDAAVLIGSCDVQGDRLEAKVVAYGPGEESWLIDYQIFWGDPDWRMDNPDSPWHELDKWRVQEFMREDGKPMRLSILGIDSGDGNKQAAVYDYVQPRQQQRVFATKGEKSLAFPGLAQESTTKRSHIRLWRFATMTAKDRIFSRVALALPGPGYIHIPQWVPDQYYDQMTAEKKVMIRNRKTGRSHAEYVQSGRNEALDLEVYCLCLLFVLQNFLTPSIFRDLARLRDAIATGTSTAPAQRGRRVRSSGVQ